MRSSTNRGAAPVWPEEAGHKPVNLPQGVQGAEVRSVSRVHSKIAVSFTATVSSRLQ